VNQARETDGTVQGLAKSAGRIGEVVGLINTIAAQTRFARARGLDGARSAPAGGLGGDGVDQPDHSPIRPADLARPCTVPSVSRAWFTARLAMPAACEPAG